MPDPIDVINAAVFTADPHGRLGPGAIARVVTETLTADHIVANAVAALKAAGWKETPGDGYGNFTDTLSDEDLANIARTVLRSVGGAS